jgi:hypothetical protein
MHADESRRLRCRSLHECMQDDSRRLNACRREQFAECMRCKSLHECMQDESRRLNACLGRLQEVSRRL